MSLAPTLWRTCRVLANRQRLRLLQYVMTTSPVGVSDLARVLQLSPAMTSLYLRALNARGLLRVKRQGRFVLYQAVADSSMPEPGVLLNALKPLLLKTDDFKEVLESLTAFTHPRRIELLRALAGGVTDIQTLQAKTRISRPALVRHLRKLKKRGCVEGQAGTYRCIRPRNPLTRTLLALALR